MSTSEVFARRLIPCPARRRQRRPGSRNGHPRLQCRYVAPLLHAPPRQHHGRRLDQQLNSQVHHERTGGRTRTPIDEPDPAPRCDQQAAPPGPKFMKTVGPKHLTTLSRTKSPSIHQFWGIEGPMVRLVSLPWSGNGLGLVKLGQVRLMSKPRLPRLSRMPQATQKQDPQRLRPPCSWIHRVVGGAPRA